MYENRYISTGLTKRTKTVKLLFKRSELLYDIKNYAYVEGDVMQVKTEHDRHQVQDIGETGNIDRVTKVLDLAHAESVEALFPYTKQEVEQETEMDDMPTVVYDEKPAEGGSDGVETPTNEEGKAEGKAEDKAEGKTEGEANAKTQDYEIQLLVPDAYSKTTVTLLVRYIHEYMVCRVMADWMSITNPTSAPKWKVKEQEMLEAMKEAVNFRTKRVRRTQTPF